MIAIFRHYNYPIPSSVHELVRTFWPPAPCTEPITYSLGTIDRRFNIDSTDLLNDIAKANAVWGNAIGRKLFEYSATAPDMLINLVYDYRQQATSQLGKIGVVIQNDRAGYDALKAKYESLQSTYTAQKANVEAAIIRYNADKKSYEDAVAYWNSQGGAPHEQYVELQSQLAALNAEAANLNNAQAGMNNAADTINQIVPILNDMAHNLNIDITSYNTVGSSTGNEFSEAEYIEDQTGRHIDVYQFSSQNELIRVLEHEFGHALGLSHVNDPSAIMYKLNQSKNFNLAPEDIAELNKVCNIK